MNNTETKKVVYKTWPVYCLFSNSIEISEEENLEITRTLFDIDKFVQLAEETNIFKKILESTDLSLKLRFLNLVNEFEIEQFYDCASDIANKYANDIKDVQVTLNDKLIEELLNTTRKPNKNELSFKPNEKGRIKYEKLRNRIQRENTRRNQEYKNQLIRNNMLLRRSSACLKQIDTQVFLDYKELELGNQDIATHSKIIKKAIFEINKQIQRKVKNPSIQSILETFKEAKSLQHGYKRTALNTRVKIMLSNYTNEERRLQFIRDITTVNDKLNLKDLKNEYYRYKLAFIMTRNIKNLEFFKDFSLQIFDCIMELINDMKSNAKSLQNPFVSLALILFTKNFRNFVHALKKVNQELDLTDNNSDIEILFDLGIIDDEWTFKIWQEKDCEELEKLYPYLVKTIYFHTKIDKTHFENTERFKTLFSRLDIHQFGYEFAQCDDENASDIYIAGKIIDEISIDNDKKKELVRKYQLQPGMMKPLEINLEGYNYWTWKVKSYCENTAYNILNENGELHCSQFYTSTDWKGPYKSAKYLDMPRIENNKKLFLETSEISDYYLATEDNRYSRKLFEFSSSNSKTIGNPHNKTDFNLLRCEASERFLIANGKMYFFNEYVYRTILVYEGISHGSHRFFYNKFSREFLLFDNYHDLSKPSFNYRIDNCYYSHNYMFISRDLSGFPEVKSLFSDYRGATCYINFVDGSFAMFKRYPSEVPSCQFYKKCLNDKMQNDRLVHMDTSSIKLEEKNEVYRPGKYIEFINPRGEYYTVVSSVTRNGSSKIGIYGSSYYFGIDLGKKFRVKHAFALSNGNDLQEVFVLNNDGRLFHMYGKSLTDGRLIHKNYFDYKDKSEEFEVIVRKYDNYVDEIHSEKLKEIDLKAIKGVSFDQISFFRDNQTIMVKFRKNDEDFDRISLCTRVSSAYYQRIEKDLRFLRLEREARLPEEGTHISCIVINNVRKDFYSKVYISSNSYHDYRELLNETIDNYYDLDYPFMLYYDKNEKKLKAQNIPKKVLKGEKIDLGELIEVKSEQKTEVKQEKESESENKEKEAEEIKENSPKEVEKNEESPKEIKKEGLIALIITSPSKQSKNLSEIESFLKNYAEAENSFYEKDLPEEFIIHMKDTDCFSEGTINIQTHTKTVENFFNTNPDNSINIYCRGNIKKSLDINAIKLLGNLDKFYETKLEIEFIPDLYRMNSSQWEKFKKESEEVWRSKRKQMVVNDEDEEVETEIDEYEEGIKDFRKYRDIFVGRMRISKYPRDTIQISSLFYRPMNYIEEINDGFNFTDEIKKEKTYQYMQGLIWLNHKIWLHYYNTPYINGNFWESDTLHNFKVNAFDTFNASLQRTVEEDQVKLYVYRIAGETSTFEDQDDSLLNQMYFYLWKWAQNQKGAFYQIMRYSFEFIGEPGIDAGGLRREYMLLLSKQILEEMKLFIKSPNSLHNLGRERDKYIPDPYAIDLRSMESFYKLGFVMAAVYASGEIININLPSIFWKYILNYEIIWEDIKSINHSIYVCLEKIEQMPEEQIEYLEEKFVTPDGKDIELKPNGKNILLTPENRNEYISLVKEKVMAQFMPAFKKMKEGFYVYVNYSNMRFLSPEKLEQTLCGMDYVDIEVLKRITKYKNFDSDHPAAKRFWRVLEGFNQDQLAGYLKYVWGRTRLSHGCSDNHELVFFGGRNNIPEAHTCFFQLDLGDYETDEELRRKLLYGVENCNEIAEDDGNYNLGAAFGM